jgi:hypothetical protein
MVYMLFPSAGLPSRLGAWTIIGTMAIVWLLYGVKKLYSGSLFSSAHIEVKWYMEKAQKLCWFHTIAEH